jgi:hypothetical protein
MSKENKFNPPVGYIITIHEHIGRVHALATKLNQDPYEIAQVLESVGLSLVTDPFDISADSGKVIKQQQNRTNLEAVSNGDN